MNHAEAKLLIATGAIDTATIFICANGEIEIWLTGEGLHPSINQRLRTSRDEVRRPATIDGAYSALKKLGWKSAVEIDQQQPAPKGAKTKKAQSA